MRCVLLLLICPALQAQTVTFEDLTLAPQSHSQDTPFTSNSVMFSSAPFSGFNYSNITDTMTPGYLNQYAAYAPFAPGAGAGGSSTYAIANNFNQGEAVITFPTNTRPTSISVTNSTYAYYSIRDGDPPGPFAFAKKFGGGPSGVGPSGSDPDYFRLIIKGYDGSTNLTGTLDPFYLADYRFTNNALDYIVSDWTTLSLAGLPDSTRSLEFVLESSDNGSFGMNTPAYFAVDNVTFAPAPEPWGLAIVCLGWFVVKRR